MRGDADAAVDLRLARGVALDRPPAQQRHHVVRPGAGQAELARRRASAAWATTARWSAEAPDGRRFALGASGGRKILGTVLQIASFLIDHGTEPRGSVPPAAHRHERRAAAVIADRALPHDVIDALGRILPTTTARRTIFPYAFACPPACCASAISTWAAPRSCRPGAMRWHKRRCDEETRGRSSGGNAERLRREPRFHGAGGRAPHLRGDGAAHADQAHPLPRRKGGGVHGRRLCARLRQARSLHGAGHRRAQPRRGPARRVARALADHRRHGRARSQDQVPRRVPGSGRHAGFRAGDQIQRHRGRRRAYSGHAEACLPRRRQRVARPRAPPVPRQRGPARRRGSGDGPDGRAAVRRGAALAPGRGRKGPEGAARAA